MGKDFDTYTEIHDCLQKMHGRGQQVSSIE